MKRNSNYFSRRIYLDYAASTPVDKEVLHVMEPYFSLRYGNPGSLHSFGQEAIAAVDKSREIVAKAINAYFREIIFTGSATESNNVALRGITQKWTQNCAEIFRDSPREVREIPRPQIIISAVEHESILETAKDLEKDGVDIVIIQVNKNGIIDLQKLKSALNERTVLVSVMYANNEIGTIQPIAEIAKIIEDCKIKKNSNFAISNQQLAIYPLFHTDAVQAFQYLDCDVQKLGIDLMTLSAHKIYGPKGIGALYIRNCKIARLQDCKIKKENNNFAISNQQSAISPLVTGGGQEFGFRSGTENVPAIVGFAKAVELAKKNREKFSKQMSELKNYFWKELKKIYPKSELNPNQQNYSLPTTHYQLSNIMNIYFPNHKSQDLLIKLDRVGIAVSSGAACSARSSKLSHVLKALGLPPKRIQESLRFSFGKYTTKQELKTTLEVLDKFLNRKS